MIELARVEDFEAAGRKALPAPSETRVGDWLVRIGGGVTKRVNSANPLHPGATLGDVRSEIEARYRARALPPRFRLTPLAAPDVDEQLADHGYALVDPSVTMAMTTRAMTRATLRKRDATVAITSMPDRRWWLAEQRLAGHADDAAKAQQNLLSAAPAPLAFASSVQGEALVALAYASIGNGCAQIANVVVAAPCRGGGLGREIVGALVGWAREQGCSRAMLQVAQANVAARSLYLSLGFIELYDYHYRVAPEAPQPSRS